MQPRYHIHLYHDGVIYVANVPELAGCRGKGQSYAEALQRAEQAIEEWIFNAVNTGKPIPAPTTPVSSARAMRPAMMRKYGPVKYRLIEKFGNLSNRQLAACIGLIAPDAPVMLSSAFSGRGTRQVRCAIARSLNEPPSSVWPSLPQETKAADDKAYYELLKTMEAEANLPASPQKPRPTLTR
ncbi:type II toxin-antitoxin system HicB family antitoxin [Herbaspirillum sp. ST 5-3]|uniref:type II toxin-antitoxin system HicB family antitoxin n=1 Tax=Oxalobacteraceae TaxID=75682 RepID=UPI0010A3D9D4|nr:type II toxin-antitoxin system HicB family antitoxin [Herbaspirillum sp. ST 5-3]